MTTETAPAGWGITAQLPPRIQRRMIAVEQEDQRGERDEKTARDQRHEEACNRALALAIANAEARGEYPGPVELATVRLPADNQERDKRTQDAIQHVLDTQRAQYQRELAWEKEHPPPPAGPPEKLHVFVDEPRVLAPAARSSTGRAIATRARRFAAVLDARHKLAAAERAAEASKNDYGLVCEAPRRREAGPVVVPVPARRGETAGYRVSYR